jgi:hypothetical protein
VREVAFNAANAAIYDVSGQVSSGLLFGGGGVRVRAYV